MHKIKTKKFFLSLLLLNSFYLFGLQKLFATQYKLNELIFDSKGKTKSEPLKQNIIASNDQTVFSSIEELETYLQLIKTRLENTRQLIDISYEYNFIEEEQNNIQLVDAIFSFSDSNSVIVFPYPSISSNDGAKLMLVYMDTNFMGLMNPFGVSAVVGFGTEEEPEDFSKITLGGIFSYDYPFALGKTRNVLKNNLGISWLIGDSSPTLDFNTGIEVGIPFGNNEIKLQFVQSIIRNKDYEEYDDELYFVEKASVSLPTILGTIDSSVPVKYIPFINASYIWDQDGINNANTDLSSTPQLTVGQTFNINSINWKGNFRDGYYLSTTQGITRDFSKEDFQKMYDPYIIVEGRFYKAWKYAGINASAKYTYHLNGTFNIGSALRGILDKQTYSQNYYIDKNNYALETPSAFTFSMDFPIHLISIRFPEDSKLSMLNFDMQVSPFVDVGLITNRATTKKFNINEGLYSGGIEVLVYPQNWKSYTARASIGFDLGNMFLNDSENYDSSWRDPSHNYEFYIGIGHHY